jgi:hypothetical protein
MEQRRSWEANDRSKNQEIVRLLYNSKIRYRPATEMWSWAPPPKKKYPTHIFTGVFL